MTRGHGAHRSRGGHEMETVVEAPPGGEADGLGVNWRTEAQMKRSSSTELYLALKTIKSLNTKIRNASLHVGHILRLFLIIMTSRARSGCSDAQFSRVSVPMPQSAGGGDAPSGGLETISPPGTASSCPAAGRRRARRRWRSSGWCSF